MVKGRQYNNAQSMHMRMCMLCLNRRDELDKLTLDLDSSQKRQIDVSVTETNSTAQYRSVRYKHAYAHCMHEFALYAYKLLYILLFSNLGKALPRPWIYMCIIIAS